MKGSGVSHRDGEKSVEGVNLTVDSGLAHPAPGTYHEDAWQVLGLGVDNIRGQDWGG